MTAYSCTTGILPETLYYGRVRAINAAGESAWSNVVSGTTPPAPAPPDAPSTLIATAISDSQIDLTWVDNSDNETGFKIERKTTAAGTYAQIHTPAADVTAYSDTCLDPETEYWYRVCAYNAAGDGGWSNEALDTTTPELPPDAPSDLEATAISSSRIDLTWTDNSDDEAEFKIERKTTAAGTYAEIATPAADETAYSDTGLDPETEYFYRVCASNSEGDDSDWSNEASATTQAGAVGAVFYIFGGDITGTINLTEIVKFDVAAGTATVVADLPLSVGQGRYFTTANWNPDNQCAYIIGGIRWNNIPLVDIVKFNPDDGTAEVVADLPYARFYHSSIWDPDTKCIYIFGGRDAALVYHNDIVKFNPATLEVTTLGVTLPGLGGNGSAVWDPTGTPNPCAYLLGGAGDKDDPTAIVKFDPTAGTCAVIPGVVLPEGCCFAGTAWDPDNNVAYLFGGSPWTDRIVKFNPAGPTVTTLGVTLPDINRMSSAAWDSVNKCAYIFGGNNSVTPEPRLDTIVKFDPAGGGTVTILETKLLPPRSSTSACPGQ
ncbi:hypothetical protein ES703_79008 [subsurface metagenome]